MAYIQREGGDRFVIPSYRDVISKRKTQLKTDILELSSKYGEFMTFHRRGLAQFEIAFSHDPGYLFGECVWSYFKRPADLIYCEAIPDTTEAYLVIVKDSGVYLDGIFPLDNIAEELVVFTTQKNHFDIYIYGEVNLSEQPTEGKFSLDAASIKSFTVLDAPLFANLPTVKAYQLQLVDVVLRQQGIGVFPVKYVIALAVVLGLGWMGYSFITMHKKKIAQVVVAQPLPENPYIDFNKSLASPAPDVELKMVAQSLVPLFTLPGWTATDATYSNGVLTATVESGGANTAVLYEWADENKATVLVAPTGFSLQFKLDPLPKRTVPNKIYLLDRVISSLVDRMALVSPGNILAVGGYKTVKSYKESKLLINLKDVSLETVIILSDQLKDLPLVLTSVSIKINDGLSGIIALQALGN